MLAIYAKRRYCCTEKSEIGRWNGLKEDLEERICRQCTMGEIEDEACIFC